MSKWARRLAIVAAGIGLLYVLALLGFQRKLLFPRHLIAASDRPLPADADRIVVSTADGEVEGWLLTGVGASAVRPAPLVIFAHGNGELIEHWADRMESYRALGVSVLLAEYRGYGRSGGDPSEDAIAADYAAFYDQMAARHDVDADRIIVHGRSLGGGAACALAKQRPVAAMVLQSTFTSVPDVSPWWAPGFLVLDPFDNLACVRDLKVPVLIAHGKKDTLIPVAHAQRLHEAAADSTLVLFDAGHNDCPPQDSSFWQDVEALLRRAGIV